MSAFKYLGAVLFSLIFSGFLVAFAQAQTSCSVYNWTPSCSTGLLNVFVQVQNNIPGVVHYSHEFQIAVYGQSPSPGGFMGSQNGTQVLLGPGSYSVSVSSNPFGYIASMNSACSGAIAAGQTQTCVVTLTASNFLPFPNPVYPPLTCAPQYQNAALGQAVNFYASGGTGSYNWSTAERSFTNVGPKLSTGFTRSGAQTVTVQSGNQTATCTVAVSGNYIPSPFYPSATYPALYYTPAPVPAPRLPNTGMEPVSTAGVAFSVVLITGAGYLLRRHVAEAFALALR